MRRTLIVEARRLMARAMARWVVAGLLVAGAVGSVAVAIASRPGSAQDLERAAARHEVLVNRCQTQAFRAPFDQVDIEAKDEFCEAAVGTLPFSFQLRDLPGVLEGVESTGAGPALILLSALLGASFVGAEFGKRTIVTTLLWDPRRLRVLGAKLLVAAGLVVLGTLLLQALLGSALAAAAALRGTVEGTDAAWVADVARSALRMSGLAALAAVAAGSAATIGGGTASALGAGALLAATDLLLRGLEHPEVLVWLPSVNIQVLAAGGGAIGASAGRSALAAGLFLTLLTAATVGAALIAFRRRDLA